MKTFILHTSVSSYRLPLLCSVFSCIEYYHFLHWKYCLWLLFDCFRSKSKRPPVDKPAAVPIVQFHPEASSPPNIQLPPPKEAPPPPRSKRQSSYDRAPPKLPSTTGRGALLSQIQEGAKLKKAVTNDRSAPRVWHGWGLILRDKIYAEEHVLEW